MGKLARAVLTLFIFLIFSFVLPNSISADEKFRFSNGKFENAPGESEEYRLIAQGLFADLVITVSESGDVQGKVQKPFSFELDGDGYTGQALIKLKGTYDFSKRTIKGIFTYRHSRVKKHTFNSGRVAELNGSRNISDDIFSGIVGTDVTEIQFTRTGTVTYAGATLDEKEESNEDITDLPDVEYQPGVDTGARFASIQGEVEMYPDGKPNDRSFAKMDVKIEPGMHIFTGEDSNVIITFPDMSTYRLPPNSEIVIKSFKPKSQLSLIAGKIWSNIKKVANNESIEVETSQAVLGIKGTTYVLEASKDTSLLKVIEGSVSYKSKVTSQAKMVNTGEMLQASKTGLGQKETFDTVAEEKKWQNLRSNSSKNTIYIVVGIVAVVVFITILLIKTRKSS